MIAKITHGFAWRGRKVKRKVRRILAKPRKWMIKIYKYMTLKKLYPSTYRKYAQNPVKENKIVFLEVRLQELTDNFQRIYTALQKKGGYELVICHIGDGLLSRKEQYHNSLAALKEIADAKYVFINDSSSLISCIPLRKETKIIQTWHACGAFKKFGFSTAEKKFGGTREQLLKYPLHKNFSIVTVSSPEVVWAYAEAFNMNDRKQDILPTGISRTDVFYDQDAIRAAYEKIHKLMPSSRKKKVILYAPTYRGRVAKAYSPEKMDLQLMHQELGEEYVIVFKHHPFVKKRPQVPEELKEFAVDMTDDMAIEELLMVSDICISDYSSLVFEFSLFERPMIFFAYDLDEYFDWRGFYYPYEEMAPGPICKETEEMIDYIKHLDTKFDKQQVIAFKEKFMSACDGHATERILELL
ncbi:MAG: CDP-glycerol glycerophosphotransferase family protein [Marvinbryantia sp.]|jgi:CDP-ribitol ribitolphosphotransferase